MNNNIKTPPAISIPEKIDVPAPQLNAAANGIPVYTLDCSQQEVVRVSFVFHAGTSVQQVPFSASTTANMLSEGTKHHTAKEVAEWLDYYGSYYDVSLDRDYAVFTFVSLAKFFEKTLEIAREILLEPLFDEGELRTYCEKRKQRLAVERSKIAQKSREMFGQVLFGAGHPYGASYSEDMYDALTREQITEVYRRRYTAGNCLVVCSGRISDAHRSMIAALTAEIPTGGDTSQPVLPAPQSSKFVFGAHEGAVQSAIRTGRLLFPRMHPDFIPMQVVTTALGGYFGSRLVHNLREEHGYTYGVFAGMVNLQHAGYMAITTDVAAEATEDALRQIFHETERMRTELMTEDELHMVRNIMTGEVMRILDGPFGIADVTIENIQNGTDNAYLERFLDAVRTITPEQVRDTARKYLDPEQFTTVVVGNPALEGKLHP